jgi:NNP family nitrate/nitrite transporter-like MFS transporter
MSSSPSSSSSNPNETTTTTAQQSQQSQQQENAGDPLLIVASYGAIPNPRILHNAAINRTDRLMPADRITHSYRIRSEQRHHHHHHGNPNTTTTITPTGVLSIFHPNNNNDNNNHNNDDVDDSEDDDEEFLLPAKERLLHQVSNFSLAHSIERGYRATELQFCSMARPHMRAMHASWICFFASYFTQFAMAPLLPQLQISLDLTKRDIWWTNVWMMVGGIPMRFMLGPLCDTYGPRVVMVWMVALCAIPCALSGLIVVNLSSLLVVRFIMGAMDAFVPCQCWITSHFVREVGGTIMALAGGLGASGSGFTQLLVGFLFAWIGEYLTGGDLDLAWRLALLVPAAFALAVAYWSFYYTDDCPLGQFVDVKKAGLMMERSAVDSFRSGAFNFNSWILFAQYAGSCGVDVTMCNGCALYFHQRFHQPIASAGAIAFLYGISAVYARAMGGYISDRLYDRYSLQGRLWIQFVLMLAQGAMNIWFARTGDLGPSMIIMILFSIFVQVRQEQQQD